MDSSGNWTALARSYGVKITESGLIASIHLVGIRGTKEALEDII